MRKVVVLLGFSLLIGAILAAQEVPTAEAYLGYSFMRINPSTKVNGFTSNGGLGSFQVNFSRNFGLVAEFGGMTKNGANIGGPDFPLEQTQFTYLFGPRVFINKAGRIAPFFEFLFGGIHNSRSFSVPNSALPPVYTVPRGVTQEVGTTATKFRTTQNAYAMGVGGGVDIKLSSAIALRPVQLDYLPSHFSPVNIPGLPPINDTRWQHNLRYSTGIIFRFGSGAGY